MEEVYRAFPSTGKNILCSLYRNSNSQIMKFSLVLSPSLLLGFGKNLRGHYFCKLSNSTYRKCTFSLVRDIQRLTTAWFMQLFVLTKLQHSFVQQEVPCSTYPWFSARIHKNTSSCQKTCLFHDETSHFEKGGKRNFRQVKAELLSNPSSSFKRTWGLGFFVCLDWWVLLSFW